MCALCVVVHARGFGGRSMFSERVCSLRWTMVADASSQTKWDWGRPSRPWLWQRTTSRRGPFWWCVCVPPTPPPVPLWYPLSRGSCDRLLVLVVSLCYILFAWWQPSSCRAVDVPMVQITMASVKFNWVKECLKWLPGICDADICVVRGCRCDKGWRAGRRGHRARASSPPCCWSCVVLCLALCLLLCIALWVVLWVVCGAVPHSVARVSHCVSHCV